MIDKLKKLALVLQKLKRFFYFFTAASFLLVIYVLLFTSADDYLYLIPSVLALLWSLACLCLLSIFLYVPPKITADLPFFQRIKRRIVRLFYYVVSFIFLALSVLILWLTSRMVFIWLAPL